MSGHKSTINQSTDTCMFKACAQVTSASFALVKASHMAKLHDTGWRCAIVVGGEGSKCLLNSNPKCPDLLQEGPALKHLGLREIRPLGRRADKPVQARMGLWIVKKSREEGERAGSDREWQGDASSSWTWHSEPQGQGPTSPVPEMLTVPSSGQLFP